MNSPTTGLIYIKNLNILLKRTHFNSPYGRVQYNTNIKLGYCDNHEIHSHRVLIDVAKVQKRVK